MPTMIFVDILACCGAALGVLFLVVAGVGLLGRRGAVACLSILVTRSRARECVQDGTFTAPNARALGVLLVLFATSIAACIYCAYGHL